MTSGGRDRRRTNGQYMVEFAMAIVIFVLVFVAFAELCIAVYNYRLMNNAALNAARLGVKGGTDAEMKWQILRQAYDLYPTAFLMLSLGDGVTITPPYGDRMQGTRLEVQVDLKQGIVIAGGYVELLELPVHITMPMSCDVYCDTDNDGQGDLTDSDDDGDGIADATELSNGTDPKSAASH